MVRKRESITAISVLTVIAFAGCFEEPYVLTVFDLEIDSISNRLENASTVWDVRILLKDVKPDDYERHLWSENRLSVTAANGTVLKDSVQLDVFPTNWNGEDGFFYVPANQTDGRFSQVGDHILLMGINLSYEGAKVGLLHGEIIGDVRIPEELTVFP